MHDMTCYKYDLDTDFVYVSLLVCRQVDHMLQRFTDMNQEMRRTWTFKLVATKEELLQMVAKNNLLFADIISKLGIMERFEIAWKNNNCNDVYEHLRADMEIENRNSNLQVKVSCAHQMKSKQSISYFGISVDKELK